MESGLKIHIYICTYMYMCIYIYDMFFLPLIPCWQSNWTLGDAKDASVAHGDPALWNPLKPPGCCWEAYRS